MEGIDLTEAELRLLLRACAHVRLTHTTPPYFRDFVAQRLDGIDAGLAARVRDYDAAQLDELCRILVERQKAADNA